MHILPHRQSVYAEKKHKAICYLFTIYSGKSFLENLVGADFAEQLRRCSALVQ